MVLLTNCSQWSFGLMNVDVTGSGTSSNTTLNPPPSGDDEPVISDEVMDHIHVYINLILRGTITLIGTGANIINMYIFFNMGIKDSNSICLMLLSFTDFVVTFTGIVGSICFTWDRFYPDTAIYAVDFEYVTVGWVRDVAYLISGWITTLLSVERCVCVLAPFKVKEIFTRGRSAIIIVIIYIVHIGVHLPVFMTQWLDWKVVDCKVINGTVHVTERMVLHTSNNRKQIQDYIDVANGSVLPFPSQIIVIISVGLMIYGLYASARIRQSGNDSNNPENTEKSQLSSRENRLVKVVLFLAIVLTLCNIPRFLAVYAKQIFTEVSLGRKYSNVYVLLWNVTALAQIINSSVNIIIYLLINSAYRQKFKEVILRISVKS